jgi:hypothetical protein
MKLSRRQFLGRSLRGAGGAAIALPFLLSREGSSSAQVGAPPERLITIYFGLGIPAILRNAGLTGVLAPLAPFASKLTIVQGLDCNASSPNNGHSHGSAGFACGFGTPVVSSKGGPSLDWVVHEAFRDPAGADTLLPTLSAGVSAGDNLDESIRYNHSWRGVNQPNLVILDTLALFETIFGAVPSLPPSGAGAADPAAVLAARQRVSVLDAVMADYRHVMSDAGGYSASVRATISSHLDTVRELERRAVAISLSLSGQGPTLSEACRTPGTAPVQMHSFLGPPVGDLAPKTTPYFDAMWSVMVDLYVLALRCDLTRFGNLMVISGGDSYPFSSAAGQVDNIHSNGFHLWFNPEVRPIVADDIQWTMTRIAAVLAQLDDPSYRDVDGATLLDNTTVVIGTELGDDVVNHGLTDMPFWIAGGRGRFRAGELVIPGRSDVDFYNTILRGLGVSTPFGDPAYFQGLLPQLLA